MHLNRDILLFAGLALAWGTSFAAIEVGLESLPPILFAALRLDVAAVLFIAAVVILGLEWRPRTSNDIVLIAIGGVLIIGAHYAFLFLGQSYVSSGVAAIVMSLVPIVTPPLAIALLPRRGVRAPAVIGLVLGLLGVTVIATGGGSVEGQAIGVALLFASAVTFAIGSVLTERFRGTLPIVSLQAWSMSIGAFLLHALSFVHPGESAAEIEPSLEAVAALAYLAVVATGGAFLAYFVLLERIGSTELSLVNYAVPVIAALFGWALLGEALTLETIGGFVLIMLGFALCKIDVLWRTTAPVLGYGPYRPTNHPDGVVVKGNVYVTNDGRRRTTMEGHAGTGDRACHPAD